MKRRRRLTAKQRRYFGKRKTRVVYKTKVKRVMARGRYRRFASRGISRAGGFKGILAPIVGGVADSYLDPMLPIDGIGATAVGMFMHNSTLKDIGLYKVGMSLGNVLPLPGRTGTQGGLL